jgi:hypothetical protein
MPQNTTRNAGARTSGTELGGFGFELGFGVAGIEAQLNQAPDVVSPFNVFSKRAPHRGSSQPADA